MSRFVLMLGAAVLEDIMLWGVFALATAISSATVAAASGAVAGTVTVYVVANGAYVLLAMTVLPPLLRRTSRARWNVVAGSGADRLDRGGPARLRQRGCGP